jgi:hypothetical protein
MKKQTAINWGRWRREPEQGNLGLDRIQDLSRVVKVWAIAVILITIVLASAGILLTYRVGLETAAKVDASTRHMVKLNEASISRTLDAVNPNTFLFQLTDDSGWYAPTPATEYVKLNSINKLAFEFKLQE